jgi:uncharacterized membrane protein
MRIIGVLVIIGLILILWYLANVMNKPVLSRMHNYYEDDKDGRTLANIMIGICFVLSFVLGALLY